ncbi:MAG: alcohol dehydrogenase catalytic domain-containing protein [Vicinamibacterales bacterium]
MAGDQYPYGADEPELPARRALFKQGAAAFVGGGAAAILGTPLAQAQAPVPAAPPAQQTPAIFTQWRSQTAGQKYRALVRHGAALDVQELALPAIHPRQVVARVEAAQACYSQLNGALNGNGPMVPFVFGHGAVATVVEVGPQVKRVQAGDRIIAVVTGNCGTCYQCLRGRAANCQAAAGRPPLVAGTMADGTVVAPQGNLGGFAEMTVAWEEMVVPIRSTYDAAELSNLACVAMTGLGMTMARAPVEAGSSVVVFGAGPIGNAAVQGARIMGASQIIVVEPIRYRRELAQKVGATAVLDPNEFADANALIARLRQMTDWTGKNPFGGGRANPASIGPDFVIEAVGGERFMPRVERYAREPHGMEVLQSVFTLCPPGGVMRTCGIGHPMGAMVSFPAGGWANGTKTHMGGNLAGAQSLRDVPQWTRLFETGQFNGAALVGTKVPLDRWREALDAAAYRTAITGIVTFT